MRPLVWCGLLFLVVSTIASPDCGYLGSGFTVHSPIKRAVFGGKAVKAEDAPWIVRLEGGGLCTGALITDRHVITAAHCFASKENEKCVMRPNPVTAICHHENSNNEKCSEERKIPIKRVYLDDFISSNCNFDFDIAVAELERPVPSSSKICLPFPPRELGYKNTAKSEAHLLGYSPNHCHGNSTNSHLQHGTTNVSLKGKRLFSPRDYEVFASCGGDSGGPLFEIHDNTAVLIGVHSTRGETEQSAVEVLQYLDRIFDAVTAYKSDNE